MNNDDLNKTIIQIQLKEEDVNKEGYLIKKIKQIVVIALHTLVCYFLPILFKKNDLKNNKELEDNKKLKNKDQGYKKRKRRK